MNEYIVVVADGSRARILGLDTRNETLDKQIQLRELEDFIDTQYLEKKASGTNKSNKGKSTHGKDSERSGTQGEEFNDAIHETERRFAKTLFRETLKHIRASHTKSVTLVAGSKMLGILREAFAQPEMNGVILQELNKNFGKQPTADIHDVLAKEGLLPSLKGLKRQPNARDQSQESRP